MNYYKVMFKSLTAGRYLNASDGGGSWIQNRINSDAQTFNLRRLSKEWLGIEVNGWWFGLDCDSKSVGPDCYLKAAWKVAGKVNTFEIMMQSSSSDRVRIRCSNEKFLQLPGGSEYFLAVANFSATTTWEDTSVFSMTLIQSALPISNQSIIEETPSFPSILAGLRPLDGTTVQLKPILHQTNLYAHERSGGSNILVNKIGANTSLETFKVWGIPRTDKYLLQASGNQFLGLQGTALMAISMPGFLEAFEIAQNYEDFTCIRIKASNGRFLQTNADGSVTADANPWPSWSDKDPSIFSLRVTSCITPDSSTIKAIKTAYWNLSDGARVQLKSIKLGKYLCPSRDDSRTNIGAHQTYAGRWETFKLQRVTETIYQIQFYKESLSNTNKGHEKRFVGLAAHDEHGNGRKVVEIANEPCTQDMFEIVKSAYNPSVVRIRATNGCYLEVAKDELVADNTCSEMQIDEAEDPSVFLMTIITPKEWAYLLKGKDDKDSRPKHLVKAANLRGWLVADSSITPALFDHLEEDVILNGTEIRIKSVKMKKYLSAQHGGGSKIVANASAAKESETFTVWETKEGNFQFLVSTRHFIGLDRRGDCKNVVADSYVPGLTETFKIITSSTDPLRVRIMAACNETFLQADKNGRVSAGYTKKTRWRYNDPSVFKITIVKKLRGEFQLTCGLGHVKNEVMADHWEDFIQEEHFKYMFDIGLNAVRIPVGWWIAEDSSDIWPFARGSLQALDNAFDWAEKHDLDVIISLHAPPDSQNGMEQNSSRDSFQGWGRTKESIAKTVKVIEFLSARYGNRSKLYAIDLLDKPAAPGVSLESLKLYYKEGYEAVRRYTSKAYVIMSNRLNANSKELLKFASGLPRSVLNIHYYDMFSGTENRSLEAELSALTSVQNGPLIFIGDWTVNWSSTAKSERIPIDTDDYKRHTLSKLQVLNRASFGWAYWALRIENKEDELAAEEKEDWSLETIVGKDYIKLNN